MIEKPECESFKLECGAEPQAVSQKQNLLDHMDICPPCTDFYEYLIELDTKMMTAFSLPVADSVISEQVNAAQKSDSLHSATNITSLKDHKNKTKLASAKPGTKRYQPWYAAAASVAVAAMAIFAVQYPSATIANDVVEHINHEPKNLTMTHAVSSQQEIRSILAEFQVELSGSNIEILSATKCPVGSEFAAHLVVRGSSGPVTILIFPNKDLPSGKIKTKEFNGRILPAEYGSIAVVGGKKENLAQMEKMALTAFQGQG